MSFLASLLVGTAIGQGTGLQAVTNTLNYGLNSIVSTELPHTGDLIDMFHRDLITKETFYRVMKILGYGNASSKLFFRGKDSLLTPEQAYLKYVNDNLKSSDSLEFGTIDADAYTIEIEDNTRNFLKRMQYNGFTVDNAFSFRDANRPLPSFSQQLQFLAKEAYEPELYTKFGLNQEIPPQLRTYFGAYDVPIPEQDRYWISHWRDIGISQLQRVYQYFRADRTDTDTDTLTSLGLTFDEVKTSKTDYTDYLKLIEYPPYIRDRLLASSFNPVPFTVLQQVYQYGVKTPEWILGRLKDYGYSDSNSQVILDMWSRKFPFKAKETLMNNILLRQKKGFLTKASAKGQLINDGIDEDTAEYQTEITNDRIQERRLIYKLKTLAMKLGKGNITDNEMSIAVDTIITDIDRRAFEKEDIRIQSERYLKRLSARDLRTGVSDGTITDAELTVYLTSIRMNLEDQALYKQIYGLVSP